jgi:predicted DsbA family dithiol-disulfide isomerase
MYVEIYSDVACPWCYVGKARFEQALDAFPAAAAVEVVYRPYQLDPVAPTPGVPMLEYLERRFGTGARTKVARVAESARGEGLEMRFERALAVNTMDAHRLLNLAEREYGAAVQRGVAEGLFAAQFSAGLDVGDLTVLSGIAAEAGMEAQRVLRYLASGEGADEVRAGIADAQRLGITAVPTFVFDGRYAVQGAQPTAVFLRALDSVERERADHRNR